MSRRVSWKPYFRSLPTHITTPLGYSQEELEELRGSNLLDAVTDVKKSLWEHCILLGEISTR
jgi:hypothetical protein